MNQSIQPLKAEKFLEAALAYMEPLKGTHIYNVFTRDLYQKTEHEDSGYGIWLKDMLAYLTKHYNLKGTRILDFGCGTGELTVRMRNLGYDAYGLDIHKKHLELAKILASENGFNEDMFILNETNRLPFSDKSFDVITMFSVIGHIDDATLSWLLPELYRVSRGIIYILVPNRLKPTDDHTGLLFVPWMPRWLALSYIKLRSRKHQYFISQDRSWDVHYRSLSKIVSIFRRYDFALDFPPDEVIYPPLDKCSPTTHIGKHLTLGSRKVFIGIPLPYKMAIKLGIPRQAFYPYLNLIFIREERK